MKAVAGLYLINVAILIIAMLSGPLYGVIPAVAFLVMFVVQAAVGGALIKEWFGKR